MKDTYVTLTVAIITAAVAMYGYFYQKRKEREFDLVKTRREIYQKLVKNLYRRAALMPSVLKDPGIASITTVEQLYDLIREKYPDVWKNITEYLEINALLSIYGTDPAVKMAALVALQGAQLIQEASKATPDPSKLVEPDLPGLVLTLRKSVYGASSELENTTVTRDEIRQLLTP